MEIQPFLGLDTSTVSFYASQVDCISTYVGMPVQLPQTLWLKGHHCCSNRGANREVPRINDAELTAATRHRQGRVLEGVVDIAAVSGELKMPVGDRLCVDGRVDDIRVRRGDRAKGRLWNAEILREDRHRRMRKPVIDVESCSNGVKIAIIKH